MKVWQKLVACLGESDRAHRNSVWHVGVDVALGTAAAEMEAAAKKTTHRNVYGRDISGKRERERRVRDRRGTYRKWTGLTYLLYHTLRPSNSPRVCRELLIFTKVVPRTDRPWQLSPMSHRARGPRL